MKSIKEYIRLFNNHSQYNSFTATTEFILPNVSHCINENDVHYNPYVEVNDLLLNVSSLSLYKNDSETLVVTILPSDATDKTIIWSSSDDTVATVTSGGVVTAIGYGDATITVSTSDMQITASCSVSVIKREGIVMLPPIPIGGLEYNTSAQTLVTVGSGTGTMMYKLDNGEWSTAIPSGTNATSYTVYYKASASTDYTESQSGSVNVIIDKVIPTVIVPTAKVLTYNGSAQELVNAGSTDYGTLKYSIDNINWHTSIPSATNVSSYVVYYKVEGNSNVYDVASCSVNCSINEKQVTATVELSSNVYTYDGIAKEPSVTVKDSSTIIDPSEYTVTYSNNINAGTATVTISDNAGGNYEVIGSATFTINKANSSLSFTVTDLTVGIGETKTNAVTVNAGDGTVTYASSGPSIVTVDNSGNVSGISSGNTTVSANISSTSNYNSATTSYNVTCAAIITAKFNVTDTSNPTNISYKTPLINGLSGYSKIVIDDVEQPELVSAYTFSTTGEHTVKYYLKRKDIAKCAFRGCGTLTSVTIPDSVTSIGESAFTWCTNLVKVNSNTNGVFNIPDGITSIGGYAFGVCDGLTSIDIPDSVTTIGNSAFNCTSLTSCTIGSGVTTIGQFAFQECRGLTSVTIPDSVTSIGNYAFSGCNYLTSMTINAVTPPTLGGYAFYHTNDCPIYVPCDSVDTYKAASGWSTYSTRLNVSSACKYLTFIATESGTFKFSGNSISYSLDSGSTWTSLASNTNTPTVSAGSKIMWKATLTSSEIGIFVSSGEFTVEGNVMSLLYGDNSVGQTDLTGKDFVFYNLFNGCSKLTSAENLSLPATTLAEGCYESMFEGCSGLTTAPELPATTLANFCYYDMFNGCTSLTTAPVLPATALAEGCYEFMFNGCTSLTTAPSVLPATTLAVDCYLGMFEYCSGLTTAPELPATTLASSCYQQMFQGCTSLNYIKAMFTTAPSSSYMHNWVSGVASSGTFVKNSAATWTSGCGIYTYPCNWTVETASS